MRGISKSYGALAVLRDIDLDVQAGERIAIIGPSGSGKTTLLRLVMTLDRPEKGTIEVEGELLGLKRVDGQLVKDDEKHLRQVRGKIGMVFQHFNLFPHMTAIENITEAPIQVLGRDKAAARRQGRELLAMVG